MLSRFTPTARMCSYAICRIGRARARPGPHLATPLVQATQSSSLVIVFIFLNANINVALYTDPEFAIIIGYELVSVYESHVWTHTSLTPEQGYYVDS